MLLIAYDIIVIIDPTRCFFLNCNDAYVNASNSTTNITISGWPLYITWPNYFQTNMNAKRIFQSIQLLCAGLFILFAALYLLTYYIYRHIKLHQQTVYNADRGTFTREERNRASSAKYLNNASESPLAYNPQHKITTYTIEAQPYSPTEFYYSPPPPQPVTTVIVPKKTKTKTKISPRPRANSVNYERLCTRCNREPRMILVSYYERKNFFPNLCFNCNHETVNNRRKLIIDQYKSNRTWRP
jgi:hypothetical protein